MTDDDDLPVLTQVLRIGTLRQSAAIEERFGADLPGARPRGTPLPADPLVIGNEPHHAIDADPVPTDRDATDGGGLDADAAAARPSADEDGQASVPHPPDAFLLPQDHDGRATAQPSTLDLPEFHAATPPVAADPTPTAAEGPAVVARRLRDAVVDDLRTRIDIELDARIAQALHAEVETVLAQLQQNLRVHLSDALRDVVAKAVDEAIAGRQNGEAPVA